MPTYRRLSILISKESPYIGYQKEDLEGCDWLWHRYGYLRKAGAVEARSLYCSSPTSSQLFVHCM